MVNKQKAKSWWKKLKKPAIVKIKIHELNIKMGRERGNKMLGSHEYLLKNNVREFNSECFCS